MTLADVFLQLNGYHIVVPNGGVESFALSVIQQRLELEDIAEWLKSNTKKVRRRYVRTVYNYCISSFF